MRVLILVNSESRSVGECIKKQIEGIVESVDILIREPYNYGPKWDAMEKLQRGDLVILGTYSFNRPLTDVEFYEFLHCRGHGYLVQRRTKTKVKPVNLNDFNQ